MGTLYFEPTLFILKQYRRSSEVLTAQSSATGVVLKLNELPYAPSIFLSLLERISLQVLQDSATTSVGCPHHDDSLKGSPPAIQVPMKVLSLTYLLEMIGKCRRTRGQLPENQAGGPQEAICSQGEDCPSAPDRKIP